MPFYSFSGKVTGEPSLGDRVNCAFMGTICTKGKAKGIVVETGMSILIFIPNTPNSNNKDSDKQRQIETNDT